MSSPYAGSSSSGGSAYAQSGTSAGSAYAGSSGSAKPPRKKRGGFLHGITSAAGRTVDDLANAAINTPGGIYTLSKAQYQDLGDLALEAVGRKKAKGRNPIPRTTAIGRAQVKATEQDVQHPLRHPGYTLLDALTVASAGAGAVGRVAEVGRTGELGALTRGAPFEERTLLTPEGKRVTIGQYSRAYGARATQKALDRLREAHPRVPIAGRSLTKKVGFQLERRRHIGEALMRTPGGELSIRARQLSAGEDKALQLVAEGVPVEKRLEAHRRDLANATKQQDKRRLRREIATVRQAARYVENKTGAGGHLKPQFRADAPKRLTDAYESLKRANASSEAMIAESGLLKPETLTERLQKPGRYYHGEDFGGEGRLYASLGPKAPEDFPQMGGEGLVLNERSRYTRPASAAASSYERGPVSLTTVRPPKMRERTLAEAEARLEELQKWHTKTIEKFRRSEQFDVRRATHEGNITRQEAQRYARNKNLQRGKESIAPSILKDAYGGKGLKERRIEEADAQFRQSIKGLLAKHPGNETLLEAQRRLEEMDALETGITAAKEVGTPFEGMTTGGSLGHVNEGGNQTPHFLASRNGRPGSLGQTETAVGRVPTRLREPLLERFTQGEQYIPAGAKKRITGPARMGANKMVGVPSKAGFQREFTGQSISRGMLPRKTRFGGGVAQAVAEHQAEVVRLTATLLHRADFKELAVDAPEDLARYVPMRLTKNVKLTAGDRELMQRAISGQLAGENETRLQGLLKRVHDEVFPDPVATRALAEREGLPIKGIKWVREDYLGDLNKPRVLVGAASHRGVQRGLGVVDAVNNASKIADLYLKPAYAIPNLLGNAALNLLQQGFAAPVNLGHALRIYQNLSPEAIAAGDAAMGEGIALSVAHNPGILGGSASKLAGGWSKLIDRRFRWSSFLYEAKRAGFTDSAGVQKLLTDRALHEKLITVAQEANSEIIDYSRLGPAEREVVRRVIFFYPWVKGSTVYAGRMLLEHPGKSAVLYGLGRQQRERVGGQLGPLPSWAQGIFPVGKRGSNPLVVNPAAASILGTPAQVAETIAGLNKGNVGAAYTAGTMVTPAMAAALTLLTGTNNFGGQIPQGQGRLSGALEGLYGGIPQLTLEQRLTQDQSQKTYPMSLRDAILQYLVGGVAPRPANLSKLHSSAAREESGRR